MHTTLVYIHVKEEYLDSFIAATAANHQASVQEPGNLRFDVMQQDDDPGRFVLCEVYTDADAAAAHKQTAHYFLWRDTVADWMVSPRQGILHNSLYPEQEQQWKSLA